MHSLNEEEEIIKANRPGCLRLYLFVTCAFIFISYFLCD